MLKVLGEIEPIGCAQSHPPYLWVTGSKIVKIPKFADGQVPYIK